MSLLLLRRRRACVDRSLSPGRKGKCSLSSEDKERLERLLRRFRRPWRGSALAPYRPKRLLPILTVRVSLQVMGAAVQAARTALKVRVRLK